MKIRVLVVDDSTTVRALLADIINADPEMEVVATAADVRQARQLVKSVHPDLITLDVEMPGQNGLIFLKNLMRLRPLPVVVISSFSRPGTDVSRLALQLGAANVVAKPQAEELPRLAQEIRAKLRAAARRAQEGKVVAIAASTGGTEAIRAILEKLPADSPPILIVQHLPVGFVRPFARRLDEASQLQVTVARQGDRLQSGRALVAPGGQHLVIKDGVCHLEKGAPVSGHRPSADRLLDSLARERGEGVIGVVLTGMGTDGAAGLAEVARCGGRTLVQDEATSVVWGMPGQAVRLGAAQQVLPLEKIAGALLCLF